MAIKLNADSWHYRLFNKNFPNIPPPRTLCPYFWILVGLIISYPIVLLIEWTDRPKSEKWETDEEYIVRRAKEREKERLHEARMEKLGYYFSYFIIYILLPALGLGITYGIYALIQHDGWLIPLIALSAVCISGVIAVLVVQLGSIIFFKYHIGISKFLTKTGIFIFTPFKWIWWMIKAGYEKACPLVQWEGDIVTKTNEDYQEY